MVFCEGRGGCSVMLWWHSTVHRGLNFGLCECSVCSVVFSGTSFSNVVIKAFSENWEHFVDVNNTKNVKFTLQAEGKELLSICRKYWVFKFQLSFWKTKQIGSTDN